MELKPLAAYAREVRGTLPGNAFAPVPSRLLWLALHVGIAAGGIAAIVAGLGGWAGALAFSVIVGMAFAGMAFVAHEALHGAVIRHTGWRNAVGWLAFMPVLISPRHWVGWHNRMHHNHTMLEGVDPDSFPTLDAYQKSRKARVADRFAFGGQRVTGFFTLILGLLGQSVQVLFSSGPKAKYLSPAQYRLALLETALAAGVWATLGVVFGLRVFLLGWVVPLIVANTILMAYIITNHSLSSMTEVNDPLVNSLSVTTPRWYETFSLGFGMHVEHHLFPAMSSRYAPRVREILRTRFADRYREMPLGRALRMLFGTGRVYKTPTTLLDPRSGRESSTL